MFLGRMKPPMKVCLRGGRVFICLVDHGDGGGEKKGACGSWVEIESSELKNRAGGDVPTRREGLGETEDDQRHGFLTTKR